MTKSKIVKLATKAEIPPGWYNGPWFDDDGNIRSGVPDCLVKFVELIQAEARKR